MVDQSNDQQKPNKSFDLLAFIWGHLAQINLYILLAIFLFVITARYIPSVWMPVEAYFYDADGNLNLLEFATIFMTIILFVSISTVVLARNQMKDSSEQVERIFSRLGTLLPLEDITQVYPRIKSRIEEVNEKGGDTEKKISVIALSGRTNAQNFVPWARDGLLKNWSIEVIVPDNDAFAPDYIPETWLNDREVAKREFASLKLLPKELAPQITITETDHVPFIHGFRLGKEAPFYWISFLRWSPSEQKFRSNPEDPYEEVLYTGDGKADMIRRDMFESWWKKVKF